MRVGKISFVLFATLMLFGCGSSSEEKESSGHWSMISGPFTPVEEKNGAFIVNSDLMLEFLDFNTMEHQPVCSNATCKHTRSVCCPSYEKTNHPMLINDKLFYIKDVEPETYDDSLIRYSSELWQCDIGGGGEKKLCLFKGLSISPSERILVYGDSIYMMMLNQPYDSENKMLPAHYELIKYDIKENKMAQLCRIDDDHYCSNANICGIWDEKLIFSRSHAKNDKPYLEQITEYAAEQGISEEKAYAAFDSSHPFIVEYLSADLKTGELSPLTLPVPAAITENGYYYSDNGELTTLGSDRKTKQIGQIDDGAMVTEANGWLFFPDNGKFRAYNESTGENIEAVITALPEWTDGKDMIYLDENSPDEITYRKVNLT